MIEYILYTAVFNTAVFLTFKYIFSLKEADTFPEVTNYNNSLKCQKILFVSDLPNEVIKHGGGCNNYWYLIGSTREFKFKKKKL